MLYLFIGADKANVCTCLAAVCVPAPGEVGLVPRRPSDTWLCCQVVLQDWVLQAAEGAVGSGSPHFTNS